MLICLFLSVIFSRITSTEIKNLPHPPGRWTEKRLIRDLFHDYEKKARPVVDGISPVARLSATKEVQQVTIEFGVSLIQILDLNENEQVLTSSVRTLYRWFDYHLVWNPEEYDNITHLSIPTSSIWLPDIALYNYADERLEEIREADAHVDFKGAIEWQPRAIYKSACAVHIQYFPFDQQNCTMKFGPWTYDAARTNITFYNNIDELDLSAYEPSPEWRLVSTKAVYTGTWYPCCDEVFPDISFQIVILRQPAFYNYVIILPCFLLSSLTLVLFCLPPETPAKMQLGMNMFQAFNFLLLILTQSIPSSASTFPLIGTYYCINMLLVTLSTFLCLIVVNCHFRGDSHSRVPWWIRKIVIDYGARFLFVNVPKRPDKLEKKEKRRNLETQVVPESCVCLADAAHAAKLLLSSGYLPEADCMPNRFLKDPAYKTYLYKYKPSSHHLQHSASNYCQNWGIQPATDRTYSSKIPNILRTDRPDWDCCETFQCECNNADNYGEQDPPSLPLQMPICRNAFSVPHTQYYPLCADLSEASGGDDPTETLEYSSVSDSPNVNNTDPDSALVDVWAAAATAKRSDLCLRPQRDEFHSKSFQTKDREECSNCLSCKRSSNLLTANKNKKTCDYSSYHSRKKPNMELYPHSTINFPELIPDINTSIYSCHICKQEQKEIENSYLDRCRSNYSRPNFTNLKRYQGGQRAQQLSSMSRDIAEIVQGIRYFQQMTEKKEKVNFIISEWRAVGGVLDRLFFVCYLIVISISIILYFPRPAE